jgi:hypothetical protein
MAIPEDNVDGTVGRVNGSSTKVGTLFSLNCNLYNIYVRNASDTLIDLQPEDSYESGTESLIDGVIESIVKELNPLAWYSGINSNGVISVVMDKAIDDAAELQTRIRRIGKDANASTTSVGPNDVDISGTRVYAATSIPKFGDAS